MPLCHGQSRAGNDPELEAVLSSLMRRSIRIAHRVISPGDEDALLPAEKAGFAGRAERLRRQSGAARIAARRLLRAQGFGEMAVPRSEGGGPCWPASIVGSLAHDDAVAVAAIAQASDMAGLGIDVEPAAPLHPDLVRLVATPAERQRYDSMSLESRLLFTLKEAVYKATSPLDDVFLDFQDVEVDLDLKLAHTRTGRSLRIAFAMAPRVVALAYLPVEDHRP